MRNTGKKIAVVSFFILIAIMLFSKTFLYYISPKVVAEYVTSGTLKKNADIDSMQIVSTEMLQVVSPFLFANDIQIIDVHGRFPRMVKKDDVLLSLDNIGVDEALIKADEERVTNLLALRAFDDSYGQQLSFTKEALEKAQGAYTKAQRTSEKRKAELKKALDKAQSEYNQIAVEGIFMGTTRAALEKRYDLSNQRYLGLQLIRDNEYAFKSPADGLCTMALTLTSGGALAQDAVLFEILPENVSYHLLLKTSLSKLDHPEIGSTIKLINPENNLDIVSLTVLEWRGENNGEILVKPNSISNDKLEVLNTYQLVMSSPVHSTLVPNSAFVDENSVFCLREVVRQGETVYIVQKCEVETGIGNTQYTPVTKGLAKGMRVITAWDRPLQEGMEVVLQE